MSFLFVDQVGSTAQLAALGDDETRPVRQALFELLTGEVERHGGAVVDNTGDGVMAVFPGAAGAVDAGVAMHAEAAQHNRRSPADRELHLRVGVHTGEVTADEQGRWFGMPVVVAARLCAKAGTGEVWTSALVAALIGDRGGYHFDDVGPLDLKGVGAPVPTVSVRWPDRVLPVDLPPRMVTARRSPLAGRQDSLATLRQSWQATADGTRRVALVSGEPGIGKSRLIAEAAYEAAAGGAAVIEGGCDEQLPVPFRPFVFAVRQLLESPSSADADTRTEPLSPVLGRLVPGLGEDPPPSTDPQAERLALFEEVDVLFASAADSTGLVVVLEDLHWADEGTLQLVSHLARSGRPGRVLLIGTYRESDLGADHPLRAVVADLWRADAARVALDGLDGEAVRDLVTSITGGTAPPADIASALAAVTAGNPFFVEEVARQIVDAQGSPESEAVWSDLDVEALAVPDRVRDVVRRRADVLGDATVEVLRLAAVVGREFPVDVVEGLDRKATDDVLDLLEGAARARLVEESPVEPERYRFRHALIRQALYEELSPSRRVRLHRSVAEVMDRQLRTEPSEVAHHWALGVGTTSHPRAVASAEQAGRAALEALAFERAASDFRSALDHLGRLDPDDQQWQARLLLGLGDALTGLAADRPARDDAYRRALESARAVGDRAALADAALGLAGPPEAMMQGDTFPVAELEEALDGLSPAEGARRARLLAALGAVLSSTVAASGPGQAAIDARSDALADESIATARALDDPDTLAFALRSRLRTWFDPLAATARLAMADEVAALGAARGDRLLQTMGVTWRSMTLAELGDRDAFARCLDEAEALLRATGDPHRRWMVASRWVTLALQDGDLVRAEELCDAYLAESQGTAIAEFATALWGNQIFALRFFQGRLEEVAWMIDLLPLADAREALRALVWARSDPTASRTILDGLVARLDDAMALRLGRSVFITMVAHAAFESGHAVVAARVRAAAAPYQGTIVMLPPCAAALGDMDLTVGLMADLAGDRADALELVDRAVAAGRRAMNRPATALAEFHAARLRLPTDPDAAAVMLRDVRAEAEAMGMGRVVADCDALLAPPDSQAANGEQRTI